MPDDVEYVLISCGEAGRSGQQNGNGVNTVTKAKVFFQWKSLDALSWDR